jgi:predicted ATPase
VNAPEIRRAHALEAQRKLRTIALQGPLVLVLDDLHLASEEAVELLCFLSTSSALGPVFFLATHRSEGQLNAEAGLGRLQRHAAELELGPLGPRASQQLLHAVAGNALEESVERKILETASGNPLFLRELSRSAPERSGAGADTFHVPGGIAAALERHVSVLPKQTRELLNVAAVAGQRFDVGVLASALGVTREATVKLLAPATRLDLVRPQTPTVFEFAHALYRQHLYDGMDERARRAAHLNVSHQLASGRLDVQRLGQLARHLALGASTQDELQQAATASQRAGEAYKQKHAHEPASQHFETALQLTRQAALPAADELYVALQLAECLWHSSKSEQARAVALDAVELARSAKDWVGFALAALAYGRQLVEPTADPELLAALDEALTRLPESEPSLRARLFARKAQSLYSTARVTERFDCADQALLHARRSSEPQALAAAFWARAYAHTGNLQLRINEWPKMVAAARDAAVVARDSFLTERAELYGMACAFEEGRIEESSLQAAQLEERAKTLGSPFLGYCLKLRAASLAIFRGSAARDELIADALACGSTVVPAFAAQVHFGHSLVHAWEASRAASLAQQLDAIARSELPDRSITVIAAFTWALSGERNRCLALYETCRQAPLHPDGLKLGLYCLLGEMDAWLGARQSVEVSYQRLLPFASYVTATSLITTISGLVGYSLGKLAHCLGDIPAAREHFRTARNLAERLESPPWVQRCDLALRQLSSPYRPGGPLRARS